MSQTRIIAVRGLGGLRATISLPPEEWGRAERVPVRLEDGQEVLVPPDLLARQEDGTVLLRLGAEEIERYRVAGGAVAIPVAREELHVGKRRVDLGKVVVHTAVKEHEEVADVPLLEETVEVHRVPVGRIVAGPVPTREEGDTIIVPLLEEVLVVEKRLRLREELHIVRHRNESRRPQRVTLRSEEATVERATNPPAAPPAARGAGAGQ